MCLIFQFSVIIKVPQSLVGRKNSAGRELFGCSNQLFVYGYRKFAVFVVTSHIQLFLLVSSVGAMAPFPADFEDLPLDIVLSDICIARHQNFGRCVATSGTFNKLAFAFAVSQSIIAS